MSGAPFNIGDRVWLAGWSAIATTEPCPVCFGKMSVVLILGNGDEVTMPCDYCAKGHGYSRGFVDGRVFGSRATPYTIDSITTAATGVEYGANHATLRADRTFATEAEALAAGVAIGDEERSDHEKRVDYGKADARKTFGWNAGYHTR